MQDTAIVYGALRSGTTMLRLMLDAHPRLCCTGEHDFLFDRIHLGPGGWRFNRPALLEDRIFRDSGLRLRDDLDGEDALDDMIAQMRARGGGRRPVLMVHRRLEKWSALLPDAPVIHFLRDPRDVARSSIGMGWAGNAWKGIDHWIGTEEAWRAAPQELRARALTVRYEDLVREPEAELARICAALGESYDPVMLSYPDRSTYGAPDARLAHQWKRKARKREVRLVEGALGELLTETGYTPSGFGALVPGPLERAWLTLQSKAATFRHAVRMFGLPLALQHRVGKWLGLRGLTRDALRQMDERTAPHLK